MYARPKIVVVGTTDVDSRLELIGALPDDFDISVLGSSPSLQSAFSRAGVEYRTYALSRRANPFLDFLSLLQLWIIFRRLRPSVVHAYDTKPTVLARIAARLAGVPVVIGTLPGLGSLYTQDNLINRVLKMVYQVLQRTACRLSDLTIFQNEDDARQMVAEGIVLRDRTTIIAGSGVSTDRFSQRQVPEGTRSALRNELGIGDREIIISMVSRVIRSKGVLEFMAAARSIREGRGDVRFLLIGPEDPDSLDRLTAPEVQQLKQAVSWPGARQDIPAVLAISDVFVLPSVYREGIPRVLLEALSMGLPVITTDSPGCREAVEVGQNGFLIPPGDAAELARLISRLVEDSELRESFGCFSRRLAVD
ncbi:MAG TPA: glycosyltransferase family 4 protein, partial [Anaerolineales bacterium]